MASTAKVLGYSAGGGAVLGVGTVGSRLLFRLAKQEAADVLNERRARSAARALENEIGLAEVRKRARELDIDVDLVEQRSAEIHERFMPADELDVWQRGYGDG